MDRQKYLEQAKVLQNKRFNRSQIKSFTPKLNENGVVSYDNPIPKTADQLRLYQAKSLPQKSIAPSSPIISQTSNSTNPQVVKTLKTCGGCNRKIGGR